MSLISCPDCSQQVSDQAEDCIHCGFPINELHQVKQIQEIICPECSKSAFEDTDICLKCGFPLHTLTQAKQFNEEDFIQSSTFRIILSVGVACVFGVISAEYFPFFGGFNTLGEPFSPARDSLVPGHVLLFGTIVGVFSYMKNKLP